MTTPRPAHSPDPLAELAPENLARVYAGLRQTAPVHWSVHFGGWVLTRHADAVRVLGDPAFLADDPIARLTRIEARGGPSLPNLRTVLASVAFYTNPPRHGVLRRFTSHLFQRLEMSGLRVRLEDHAAALLAAARLAGGIDLVAGYGGDLALFAIHTLLGLPSEDCVALAGVARDIGWIFDASPRSLRELRHAESEVGRLLDYFEPAIAARRAGREADGFSTLVRLNDAELGLGDRDLAGFCTFFFIGGQETTATGIAASAVMLLEEDAARAALTANAGKLTGAAREFLRLAAPFQYVVRVATADAAIGGETIGAGERVNIILGAANRDPAAYPHPDTIDFDRAAPDSLAFGHGAYRCLGAGLAQVETEVALAGLVANPDLRLAPGTAVWGKQTRVPSLTRAWAEFG
ncbi:MAG: cytochrome P450 [Caulobacteraceae bacterium]